MSEQPGQTMTYSSRVAGERIITELDRLTPWAALQVLEWASNKTLARADTSVSTRLCPTTGIIGHSKWL